MKTDWSQIENVRIEEKVNVLAFNSQWEPATIRLGYYVSLSGVWYFVLLDGRGSISPLPTHVAPFPDEPANGQRHG